MVTSSGSSGLRGSGEMTLELQLLEVDALGKHMLEAARGGAWDDVAELSAKQTQLLHVLDGGFMPVSGPVSGPDTGIEIDDGRVADQVARIEGLLRVNRKSLELCVEERQRVMGELQRLAQGKRANKAYDSSQYNS